MSKDETEKKVSKAGIILFDRGEHAPNAASTISNKWVDRPGMQVLATYTQGRFDDHGLYLVPPKGAIDPLRDDDGYVIADAQHHIVYEAPVVAALRECREETGIDIEKLLGDKYPDFLAGKAIENVVSAAYPGVTILHASAVPVKDHIYVSGHGSRQRAQYFAIEVSGIDHLKGHLKSVVPFENTRKPESRIRSNELAKQKGLPDFEAMMNILRTGVVPAVAEGAAWSGDHPKMLLLHPQLPKLEKQWLRANHQQHEHLTQDEWLRFMADPAISKEYKAMLVDIEALKTYLEKKQLIGDCNGCMKMDTKDRPLTYYKEGGQILRLRDLVASMDAMAEKNPIYARATWGEYSGAKKPAVSTDEQFKRSQIAPMLDYLAQIAPMEIASAAMPSPDKPRERAMRAVIGLADPVVASQQWRDKVLAQQQAQDSVPEGRMA